jgi:hypothetical protein
MRNSSETTISTNRIKKDPIQNRLSLEDLSIELRKIEASKPLYLARYE